MNRITNNKGGIEEGGLIVKTAALEIQNPFFFKNGFLLNGFLVVVVLLQSETYLHQAL
jgi:hypothetical protein